jgi:ATP-dependent protease ClpP protease subunit
MDELNLYISGEIGFETTADGVREQIKQNASASLVFVHIASPGGGVYQGRQISAILKNLSGKTVAMIDSYCGSIATQIALSCDEVRIDPQARFMIHNSATAIEGNKEEMKKAVTELARIDQELAQVYVQKTGLPIETVNEMMVSERIMTGEEAVKLGFADTLLQPMKAVAKFELEYIDKMEQNEIQEVQKSTNKILDMMNKFMGVKSDEQQEPKNIAVELADGATVFVRSEDGEFEGKQAYMVDADGEVTETPAPDGTHALRDGRSITVENGIITSVQETPEAMEDDKEKEEMKAKIAELEAKLKAEVTAKAEAEVVNNTMMEQMKQLSEEVKNLSSLTVGKPFEADKGHVAPPSKDATPEAPTGHKMDAFAKQLTERFK